MLSMFIYLRYLPIIVLVVSNIEAIQSQVKNIYTNTLSTYNCTCS